MDDAGNKIELIFRLYMFYNELRNTYFIYRLIFEKSGQLTNANG